MALDDTLFVVPPNWAEPLVERYAWLTDVQVSAGGTENRIVLRDQPRRTWTYRIVRSAADARRLDALTWGWDGSSTRLLPVWTDAQRLAADLPAGSTVIPCDTDGRDFRPGAKLVLADEDGSAETGVVDIITSSTVSIVSPTVLAWSAGARLAPLRAGRPSTVGRGYHTAQFLEGEASFELTELDDVDELDTASATTYRTLDVDTRRPNRASPLAVDASRVFERIDSDTGVWAIDDLLDRPVGGRTLEYVLPGRDDARAFIAWLAHLRGRSTAFWQPTFQADLELTADPVSGATQITVEAVDYMNRYALRQGRRDVALYHRPTGTWVLRRVLLATASGSDEVLDLDTALPLSAPASEWVVSWLELVRLAADEVEIAWLTPELARVQLAVREIVVEG